MPPRRSGYIGYILAENPKSSDACTHPLETVVPLTESIGLTVDISCSKKDSSCVASTAAFSAVSSASVLICWQHERLTKIFRMLGVPKRAVPKCPGYACVTSTFSSFSAGFSTFNLGYDTVSTLKDQMAVVQTSEGCPGLDDWPTGRLLRPNNRVFDWLVRD
ncbi:hypothetical protein M0805_003320 [Coniferiporia weirii]|nr:hypothetical protein M0805_003320 [Coniferiporia weirii]